MKVLNWATLDEASKQSVLMRASTSEQQQVQAITNEIIHQVKINGDKALIDFSKQFDGVAVTNLAVETNAANVCQQNIGSIQQAITNIRKYHLAIKPKEIVCPIVAGIELMKVYKPIQRVGLYVPGGRAPLISSLLMLAIPAQVAGCPIKVVCTPCNQQGEIDPMILTAAKLCGIERIYGVGGAQAIAAMAYGTETIPKVDKIFGPGNQYVTMAKTIVAQDPFAASIDMPAGPSEVMVLADETANAEFVAADLLSQAEHGADSQVILVSSSEQLCQAVFAAIECMKSKLQRKSIIEKSLENSCMLICDTQQQMITIANRYAAQHLIINTKVPQAISEQITAAGSIFLGQWAAESMGDYISGSNHVLPTYGAAQGQIMSVQ